MVVAPEQQAQDGQDKDGEDGDDDAGLLALNTSGIKIPSPSPRTHQDHACTAPTSGFMMKMVSETGGCA